MEDGELMSNDDGEAPSDPVKDGEHPLAKEYAQRDGNNRLSALVENNTPEAGRAIRQNQKKRSRKKDKKTNSECKASSASSSCKQDIDDRPCDSDASPSKRVKSERDGEGVTASKDEAREGDLSAGEAVLPLSSGTSRKKAKKEKKRKASGNNGDDSTNFAATGRASALLQKLLSAGVPPPDSKNKSAFLMKTIDFGAAVRQFLEAKASGSRQAVGGRPVAADKRVVVVWLSQVSAKMFASPEESFKNLKSLPGFTFEIENPGSPYFSKLGLEAFMVLPDGEDEGEGEEEEEEGPSRPFTKADCLLSEAELVANGFPMADSAPQDWAQYFTLGGTTRDTMDTDAPALEEAEPPGKEGEVPRNVAVMSHSNVRESRGVEEEEEEGEEKEEEEEEEEGEKAVPSRAENGLGEGGKGVPQYNNYPIFALDCEMVSTEQGLELARVSVVDEALQCRYDSLVRPPNPILDYLTRYSGITEETLRGVTTTLLDVQRSLTELLPGECILAGHSLENDFGALKLLHRHVIDTSCLFTPSAPTLFKPGLRHLAKQLLVEDIQDGPRGHSSVEDATACMKLVQRKLREGRACVIPWSNKKRNLISELAGKKRRTGIVDKPSVVNLFGQEATEKSCVAEDGDAVTETLRMVPGVDFAFVQLHAVENYLRTSPCVAPTVASATKLREALDRVDEEAARVVRGSPPGSVVFVVCGSSCLKEIKKLQTEGKKGRPKQRERLKEEVAIARRGIVKAFLT